MPTCRPLTKPTSEFGSSATRNAGLTSRPLSITDTLSDARLPGILISTRTSPPLTVSGWVDSVRISKSVFVKRVCAAAGADARASAPATATAIATDRRAS
ncbi:MAG: hypothetical protein DMF92_16155 [Acidobacteria bacterium]|nr:MAG: hypothetical protein DMF92_16155 [Acidobacteriota bacterium]